MNDKNLVIKCDCHGHSIELEHNDEFNEIELSVWYYGNDDRELRWKERFRWCWRILRTGMPWTDMIILTHEKMDKIVKWYASIKNNNNSDKQLLFDSKK